MFETLFIFCCWYVEFCLCPLIMLNPFKITFWALREQLSDFQKVPLTTVMSRNWYSFKISCFTIFNLFLIIHWICDYFILKLNKVSVKLNVAVNFCLCKFLSFFHGKVNYSPIVLIGITSDYENRHNIGL